MSRRTSGGFSSRLRTVEEDGMANALFALCGPWARDEDTGLRAHGLYWFARKPKDWRRRLIQRPWMLPVAAMHLAASVIQRAWRASSPRRGHPAPRSVLPAGKWVRKGTRRRLEPQPAVLQALRRRYLALLRNLCEESAVAASGERNNAARAYASFEDFCAALIQGMWRSYAQLRVAKRVARYKSLKLYHVAAFEIQRAWHIYRYRHVDRCLSASTTASNAAERNLVLHAKRCDRAAARLQRAWRASRDCKAYKALKGVVATFQGTGDPCMLLRSVLPRESMLLDPAMQVHVRFRLGGSQFPPNIYYKIYTHGAVVDVCAFAPRNYAGETVQRRSGRAGDADWYQRQENNGWRPLAARFGASPSEKQPKDEIEKATSQKVVKNFHFSSLKRRQDMDRKRKQRTQEWMRKLYGMQSGSIAGPQSSSGTSEVEDSGGSTGGGDSATPYSSRSASLGFSTPEDHASPLTGSPGSSHRLGAAVASLVPRPPLGPAPAARPPSRSLRGVGSTSGASWQEDDGRSGSHSSTFLDSPTPDGSAQSAEGAEREEEAGREVEEDWLVEWSRQLDFDAYMDGWKATATSGNSEGARLHSTAAWSASAMRSNGSRTLVPLVC